MEILEGECGVLVHKKFLGASQEAISDGDACSYRIDMILILSPQVSLISIYCDHTECGQNSCFFKMYTYMYVHIETGCG